MAHAMITFGRRPGHMSSTYMISSFKDAACARAIMQQRKLTDLFFKRFLAIPGPGKSICARIHYASLGTGCRMELDSMATCFPFGHRSISHAFEGHETT